MNNTSRLSLIIALVVCPALGTAATATDRSVLDHCYMEWSEAAPIVQREALTPVRELHIEARRRNIGDIVRVTLCSDKSRYIYRLLVREPSGRVVTLVVSAESPFPPRD